jgi:hypothetical protein
MYPGNETRVAENEMGCTGQFYWDHNKVTTATLKLEAELLKRLNVFGSGQQVEIGNIEGIFRPPRLLLSQSATQNLRQGTDVLTGPPSEVDMARAKLTYELSHLDPVHDLRLLLPRTPSRLLKLHHVFHSLYRLHAPCLCCSFGDRVLGTPRSFDPGT